MPSREQQLQLEHAWNRRMREFRSQRKTQRLKRVEIAERDRMLNFLRKIEHGNFICRIWLRLEGMLSELLRRSVFR